MSVMLPPFQHLVDAHWRDVARLAAALAGPGDGDDVAQEAWTRALAAYPALTHAGNLRSWLLTVTARCATDSHRARQRRAEPSVHLPQIAAPEHPDPPDESLWAAVRALPERQRRAIALRTVGQLTHAEVADALGTTPAASRRLVSDALKTLRNQMAPAPTNPEDDDR